eukprot:1441125-Rhodomonas_salina.2
MQHVRRRLHHGHQHYQRGNAGYILKAKRPPALADLTSGPGKHNWIRGWYFVAVDTVPQYRSEVLWR